MRIAVSYLAEGKGLTREASPFSFADFLFLTLLGRWLGRDEPQGWTWIFQSLLSGAGSDFLQLTFRIFCALLLTREADFLCLTLRRGGLGQRRGSSGARGQASLKGERAVRRRKRSDKLTNIVY